jgi:hypothetical protein
MRVARHPEADQELEAAALWYEEREPGLGEEFLNEFQQTLRRILADPERWRESQTEFSSFSLRYRLQPGKERNSH